ncbi:translocase [Tropicibacter sp. R16_0]|uniref:preprotein translocase subunit SecA n=1 Tax=Tropicibacter sp. R16_0 TaxID=2821102 RepID=UPI001ADD2F1F|nr:translocase [Tropicibacter sp. R16_0]MBO9451144.1 translocase [Tropicibacter sp. R16_0]
MSDTTSLHLPKPRISLARPKAPGTLDRWVRWANAPLIAAGHSLRGKSYKWVARRACLLEAEFRKLSDDDLRMRATEIGSKLRRKRNRADFAELSAVLREVVRRTHGFLLNQRQIQGGAAIWSGCIAEMETGEGKTITAVLPAAACALAGEQSHVITVNDYLAKRDHEITLPVFQFLGLRSALVIRETPPDDRWDLYRAPVVYASNTEIAFDHLRDRTEVGASTGAARAAVLTGSPQSRSGPRLPALDMAIVDEADSVLIDEARTPLILSGGDGAMYDEETCVLALEVAKGLREKQDFRLVPERREVSMLPDGKDRLAARFSARDDRWASQVYREDLMRKALSALYLYEFGRDYLLKDGKVQIVDENTGRVFEDRSWSMGIHQLIEVKEGTEVTPERRVMGRLTYQSLFGRYHRVGGMTGTVVEAARELWQVYKLTTARIPTNRPSQRYFMKDRIFSQDDERLTALLNRVSFLSDYGKPILIGTRTVAASEYLSSKLSERGLDHALLNAQTDEYEAEIIANAGLKGHITIATNMAGRGTDIKLDDEVRNMGGLHVILTERHDSGRIDRQLQGRCARQGDPGTCEAYLSLEDQLLASGRLPRMLKLAKSLAKVFPLLRSGVLRMAQRRIERAHGKARFQLLQSEANLDRTLAFTGVRE